MQLRRGSSRTAKETRLVLCRHRPSWLVPVWGSHASAPFLQTPHPLCVSLGVSPGIQWTFNVYTPHPLCVSLGVSPGIQWTFNVYTPHIHCVPVLVSCPVRQIHCQPSDRECLVRYLTFMVLLLLLLWCPPPLSRVPDHAATAATATVVSSFIAPDPRQCCCCCCCCCCRCCSFLLRCPGSRTMLLLLWCQPQLFRVLDHAAASPAVVSTSVVPGP